MLGKELTYLDFAAYEFLDYNRLLDVDGEFGVLHEFMKAFEALPSINAYMKTERFRSFPIYAERSYIGRAADDWKE